MLPHGGAALRPAFDILDADADGRISHDDLSSFYAGLPGDAIIDEEDVVGMMILFADEDRDGYVGYEEFKRVVVGEQGRGQGGGGGVMVDVFRMMDVDRDGKLSREDVAGFMKSAGFPMRDEDVEAMVMLGGGGGDVTYDDLIKILGIDDLF